MSNKAENFLIAAEAAAILRIAKRTLDAHRSKGTGPRFRRHGDRIVNRLCDILAWLGHRDARNAPQRRANDSPAQPRGCISHRHPSGTDKNRLSNSSMECESQRSNRPYMTVDQGWTATPICSRAPTQGTLYRESHPGTHAGTFVGSA